jgi:DNA-binding response OmpR family regulator
MRPRYGSSGFRARRTTPRDVWGYRSPGRTRTLDAHACRLRRRLEAAGGSGLVVNLRGVGYRLGDGGPLMAARSTSRPRVA